MLKKIIISLFLFLTPLTGFAADTARPEVADHVKAWESTDGIQVWTLRYGKLSEHKALVQITNVDHEWNKKIQVMNVEKKNGRTDYILPLEGKPYTVLTLDKYNYGELYLPDESSSFPVRYSEYLSSEGDAQNFLSDYLKQKGKSQ